MTDDDKGAARLRKALNLISDLQEPPTDGVQAIAIYLKAQLAAFSDTMEVDSGFGFGEACLDFWMDGKAIRVVVTNVPELDREAAND